MNQLQPPVPLKLKAEEVAAVLSYVRTAWNNDAEIVQPSTVRESAQ